MEILDQNNECMQECYECQDEHQEHFECHDEHQETILKIFFYAKKTCKTPNLEIFNVQTPWMQKCTWKTTKDTK